MRHHISVISSVTRCVCSAIFVLTVLFLFPLRLDAVSAWPGSGLVGDEWYHYNPDTAGEQTRLHAARIAAKRRATQSVQATFPLTGEVRSIVILVNFKDVQFTVPNANSAFSRMLNEVGYSDNGATGSAADYFRACSYSQFRPVFDVYGPYTLSANRSYYGSNDSQGNDRNAMDMIIDACMLAHDDGVDFSQYDIDADGTVDNVFVYYAGTNPAEGGPADAIWPHRSVVWRDTRVDGKRLYDYACTSELSLLTSRNGSMCGIGTFCHEFGHVLGLPDLYNTSDGTKYTVGTWDIMSGGNYNNNGRTPPSYSAFERFALGWLTPVQLQDAGDYLLPPVASEPQAFLIATAEHNLHPLNPAPNEYWLVENRQRVGWDAPYAALPGVGLLISHITHVTSRWYDNTYNNQTPLGYDICEAYSRNPSSSSASDTYPGTSGITTFIPTSNNGTILTDCQLTSIRQLDAKQMSFHFGGQDGRGFTFEPTDIPQLTNYILDGKSTPQVQKIVVTGRELESDSVYAKAGSSQFMLSTDGTSWHKDTVWLPALSTDPFVSELYLKYIGTRQCQQQTSTVVFGTVPRNYGAQISLIGYAERPTLIGDIEVLEPRVESPYSFVARWKEQTDAEMYYLTLCKWRDEPSESTQDFEEFVTSEKIAATGWQTNFLRTTTTSYDGRTALLFTSAGDYVQSEQYLAPVASMSFWLSQSYLAGDYDAGGVLLVEASADGAKWSTVAELKLTALSAATVKSYTFTEQEGYVQFRFTCTKTAGSGGIILDGFSVKMDRTFEYLYRGDEYAIYAPADSEQVIGLQPNTLYSYQLQCVESKGCTQHTSALTHPRFVTTLRGEDEKSNKMTVYVHGDHVSVFLKSTYEVGAVLYFFDLDGRLVTTATPVPGTDECQLPATCFDAGKQYIIKLANNANAPATIQRKLPYGKLVMPR